MASSGQSTTKSTDSELDLQQLFKPLRRHWLRLLVIWVLSILVVAAVVAHMRPKFSSLGMLHLESETASLGAGVPDILGPMMGGDADLESQKEILRSDAVAAKVISVVGLNATVEGPAAFLPARPWFWEWQLEKNPGRYEQGLRVREVVTAKDLYMPVVYTLRFTGPRQFELLSAATGNRIAEGELGAPVQAPQASFVVSHQGHPKPDKGLELSVTVTPVQSVLKTFKISLNVGGGGQGTLKNKLITVQYSAESPYVAQEVVKTMVDHFMQLNRHWNTSVSRSMLQFVEGQVEELRADMELANERLAAFQTKSGLVSLDSQVQEEIAGIVEMEVEIRQQRLRLYHLERLIESLETGRTDLHLTAFVDDEMVRNMAGRLAELDGQIAAMKSEFNESYPPLKSMQVVRAEMLASLKTTLVNFADKARDNVRELEAVVEREKTRFSKLPEQSKSLANYMRSAKVFEELYLLLLREKQKARIAEASTLSNVRVVNEPLLPLEPRSPQPKRLLVLGALGSLLFAMMCVVIPAMRIQWFTEVEELREQYQQPIFGIVPRRAKSPRRGSEATIEILAQSPFAEAIRLLRTNLLRTMAGNKSQVLMVGSAMPGDGKTSIAVNLASSLIRAERIDRVLLIDADMPHPTVHSILNLPQSPGLSELLNGDATLEEVTHTVSLPDGSEMDVITAGQIPPAPGDLIESQTTRMMLDQVRANYTFTIIDSPPYPLVAMAATLASHVDRVLSVCSIGRTPRAIFRRHADDLSAVCKHHGLIVNMLSTSDGQYGGYGYGYGYGQNAKNAQAGKKRSVSKSAAAL